MSEPELDRALRVLSDPTRLKLIQMLLGRNYCVRALALKLGITESAVSQHIKALRETGLLDGVKYGYHMHYAVQRERLKALGDWLTHMSCEQRQPSGSGYCGCDVYEEALCRHSKTKNTKGESSC